MANEGNDQPESPRSDQDAAPQVSSSSWPVASGVSLNDLIAAGQQAHQIANQIANSPAYRVASSFHEQMREYQAKNQAMLDNITRPMREMQALIDRIAQPAREMQSLFAVNRRLEPWASLPALQVQWEESTRALRALQTSPAAQLMHDTLEHYRAIRASPMAIALEDFHAQQAEWRRTFDQASPAIASFRAAVALAAESPAYRTYFESSFAGDLLERLNAAETALSPEEKAQRISSLILWLQQKLKEYPPSRIIYITYTCILVPLLWVVIAQVYSEYRDTLGERQHSEEMHKGFDRLGEQIESSDKQDDERYAQLEARVNTLFNQLEVYQTTVENITEHRLQYGVSNQVTVREEPRPKSEVLAILAQGAVIEEIDGNGRWLYVEYFNYIDGELNCGWVYKRNLVLLDAEGEK